MISDANNQWDIDALQTIRDQVEEEANDEFNILLPPYIRDYYV